MSASDVIVEQDRLIVELLDACILAELAFKDSQTATFGLGHAAMNLLGMVIKKAQAR
jgi:hypothetical protein